VAAGGARSFEIRSVSRPQVHLESKRQAMRSAYLRAAQAYMLISMPTGTSTIFGVFQAILVLLLGTGRNPSSATSYSVIKSSPVKFFVMIAGCYAAAQKEFT
jgi:hypothetical protein